MCRQGQPGGGSTPGWDATHTAPASEAPRPARRHPGLAAVRPTEEETSGRHADMLKERVEDRCESDAGVTLTAMLV